MACLYVWLMPLPVLPPAEATLVFVVVWPRWDMHFVEVWFDMSKLIFWAAQD